MFDCIMFQGNKIKKEVNEGKNGRKKKGTSRKWDGATLDDLF